MRISYNWISEYLPVQIDHKRLNTILTSIGLEVESMELYEGIKGSLQGLVVGEIIECTQHPNADKLTLTRVNVGNSELLQIVCGAPNVAVGQKVVVAPVGTTIYPKNANPVTMKMATIRGVESYGMICAEDEIGISDRHDGILVLPDDVKPGSFVVDHFKPASDWIYEIGLTPNRMDAMSHLGVARDVCAFLSHHEKVNARVKTPDISAFREIANPASISVSIENTQACQRYSGVTITGVTVKESPRWLQEKLLSIGQRPINNIVDITNFILHETGQPLHAFDADNIGKNKIIVKNLPGNSKFITLDLKERTLSAEDLMICDGNSKGMCIAGVFGGLHSGVTESTKNIFLESAWFNPVDIRKTSFRHGLRTDAATRFEKNVDISNTVNVLKRAAMLMEELAGGTIASKIVDVYPSPTNKVEVNVTYDYIRKLSGKKYSPEVVKNILQLVGFEIVRDNLNELRVAVPYSKPDIHLPADLVEEIMRIDGYDNIEIPSRITITPSIEVTRLQQHHKEKVSYYLVGLGFHEIFTNSITNAAYFDDDELKKSVRLLNNLSVEHNIMRPSMLETGLEAVAYNLNRKNTNLHFFEFGKTYTAEAIGDYKENEHLCFYITGNKSGLSWNQKESRADIFYLKGIMKSVFELFGLIDLQWLPENHNKLVDALQIQAFNKVLARIGSVRRHELNRFDIRQPVFFANIDWVALYDLIGVSSLKFQELPKQLPVHRDLAIVVPKTVLYGSVEKVIMSTRLDKLQEIQLFDVFESEKLGTEKKSIAVSLSFLDEEKTLTDKDIDQMMNKVMTALESELNAEIRK